MKKLLAMFLVLCTAVFGLAGAAAADELNWEAVEASYYYSLSLMMMNATKEKITNTAVSEGSQAPINQLGHARKLASAKSLDVVTPNTDTIYSQAFLDLRDTAMVLVKPKVDRFVTVQLMDAYTNTVQVLGTGGDTQDERSYLLTGPDFMGEVPADLVQVALPQNMAWMLVRTLCKGTDDLENVHAIQNQFKLLPLGAYLSGEEYVSPQGSYSEKYDFVPVNHVLGMTPQEYFDTANQLMLDNPPTQTDDSIMDIMETIHVGPGKTFDAGILGEAGAAKWKNMIVNLEKNLVNLNQPFRVGLGQWKYLGRPISEFGNEYAYRALVSLGGLGANPVDAAVYARGDTDELGDALSGSQSYNIHFEKDALPKTRDHGFWSITVYNTANFLIDNPLNRYDINDRDTFVFNEDGSLDIIVQKDAPADAALADNWLPVAEDDFHLYLRIYLPHEDVLNGSWSAPSIIRK